MSRRFEIYQRFGRHFVQGWLEPEVLPVLAILDSAQRARHVSGAVAEIGVHHGKLFIGLRLLQRSDEHSVAIDLFEDQQFNIDNSGNGNAAAFRKNVERWASSSRVATHQADSTQVQPETLRNLAHGGVRIFSVDGGHTESIVLSDMNLAESVMVPGGIVVADDVFNQTWPGVAVGTLRYLREGGGLVPFAIGFNKVLFALPDVVNDYQLSLQTQLSDRPFISVKVSEFAGHQVVVIGRLARRPRYLVRRNKTARRIYFLLRPQNSQT